MPATRAVGNYVGPTYYAEVQAGITAAVAEAAATPFQSLTGRVRFYIKINSGNFTDEVLTVYTQAEEGDTVYIASPLTYACVTAPADESKFTGDLDIGPGWHKAIFAGTFTAVDFDLLVKDIEV